MRAFSSHLQIIAFTFLLTCLTFTCFAQRTLQQRTDSVAELAKQYVNEKDADKLYELTGQDFRNAIKKKSSSMSVNNPFFPWEI